MTNLNIRTGSAALAVATLAACCAALSAGCSLGGGSDKAGGAPSTRPETQRTVTLRFATGDPASVATTFISELRRASGGSVHVVTVPYDSNATDVDQRIARDVAEGRLDVADVGGRAWESLGVKGFRAFQTPFLVTSEALLERLVTTRRLVAPLLRSLAPLQVTGLAVVPRGVRYLFGTRVALDTLRAFDRSHIRVNVSPTTSDILRELHARPSSTIPNGTAVIAALRSGRLDAVEADIRIARVNRLDSAAPHVDPDAALFAKVSTLVASTRRLRELGPTVAGWVRSAAASAAAAAPSQSDYRTAWSSACGAGLQISRSTPRQLDPLHAAELNTYAKLDGDTGTALAIDRIGLLATGALRTDSWARCGRATSTTSATAPIDGSYVFTVTDDEVADAGQAPGNEGTVRVVIGNGRYALLHMGPPDPTMPEWDFTRDPVEVGTLIIDRDQMSFRPDTSIRNGSKPATYRFELFRDRLRWSYVRGSREAALPVSGEARREG